MLRLLQDVAQVIQTLATAPLRPERPRADGESVSEGKTESASECVVQLTPWPTTWSMNFSDRLVSMTGAGSELNTEEQDVGRRQARMLNASLSGADAANGLSQS